MHDQMRYQTIFTGPGHVRSSVMRRPLPNHSGMAQPSAPIRMSDLDHEKRLMDRAEAVRQFRVSLALAAILGIAITAVAINGSVVAPATTVNAPVMTLASPS